MSDGWSVFLDGTLTRKNSKLLEVVGVVLFIAVS